MPSRYENTLITSPIDEFHGPEFLTNLLFVLNRKLDFAGMSRYDATEDSAIYENPTDYEDGPVVSDISDDLISCRAPDGLVPLMDALMTVIPDLYDAVYVDSPNVYRWVDGTTGADIQFPVEWTEKNYSLEAAQADTGNWYRFMNGLLRAVNNLTRMDAFDTSIEYAGSDSRTLRRVAGDVVNIITTRRHKRDSLDNSKYIVPGYPGGAIGKTVKDGVTFAPIGAGDPYYTPKAGEVALIKNLPWPGTPGVTTFKYEWIGGLKTLVNTGYRPGIYKELTASNWADGVEFESYLDEGSLEDDVSYDSVYARLGCTLGISTSGFRWVTQPENNIKGFRTGEGSRGWSTSSTSFLVRVRGYSGIPIKIPIDYTGTFRQRTNGAIVKSCPYGCRIAFGSQTHNVPNSSFVWTGDDEYGRVSGTWRPEITPASDDETYLLTQEILSVDVSEAVSSAVSSVTWGEPFIDGGIFLDAVQYPFGTGWVSPSLTSPQYSPQLRLPWSGLFARLVSTGERFYTVVIESGNREDALTTYRYTNDSTSVNMEFVAAPKYTVEIV